MTTVLMAVGVSTGVFLLLTLCLIVSEKFLVNYGECTVRINGDEHVFKIKGGDNLLSVLREKKIGIQSACAGKGTCGYCKVRVEKGGGQVLPTERPYMSRTELKSNTRLACQVKVKEDMDISIPDFLETVKTMVKNKTFNTSKRWRFILE